MLTDDEKARLRAEECFKHEVRKQLERKPPQAARDRIWSFVNSAFGLWLLSTVVLGLATSVFSRIQAERAEESRNRETYRKLEVELANRVQFVEGKLDELLSSGESIWPGPVFRAGRYFDAGRFADEEGVVYVFDEFKDRTFRSLIFELDLLSELNVRRDIRRAGRTTEQAKALLISIPGLNINMAEAPTEALRRQYVDRIKRAKRLIENDQFSTCGYRVDP